MLPLTEVVGVPERDELAWVERIAKYCADTDGMPLIAGRILGWLTICDPPEQSAGEIAEAIGASRASLTTNLRLLTSIGFLSQVTRTGDRTVYYRVDDDAWEKVLKRQIDSLSSLGSIMGEGVALVGDQDALGARVRTAHEAFAWLDETFASAAPLPSIARQRPQQRTRRRGR